MVIMGKNSTYNWAEVFDHSNFGGNRPVRSSRLTLLASSPDFINTVLLIHLIWDLRHSL